MSLTAGALAGSQPTLSLGGVLDGVAERLQARFTALLTDLPAQPAENRPSHLLHFLHDARQQLLRAAALVHDSRKYPPLRQLVAPGGVLDIAASHARALQTTADELFRGNGLLLFQRVPLFNVPDALDVLATGTYSNLPAVIQDMRGPRPAQEREQQRLVSQLNHLLYAHLLKACLPECLQLVEVTGGFAVLRCPGLYEVQLSLFQQPYPPQVKEAQQDSAAVAAAAAAPTEQQAGEAQAKDGQAVAAAGAQEEGAPSKPEVRWQWTLTHAVLLPNAAEQQPLRPVQMEGLLRTIRERMWLAADAAAVEAAKRQVQGTSGDEGTEAGAAAPDSNQQQQQQDSAAARPAMSGATSTRSGPAASTLSGLSGPAGSRKFGDAAAADPSRGLQLKSLAADEVALPLRVMHGILRDVAAQVLLQEVRRAAQQLAGPGSKWDGHLKLARAEQLTPGICMQYWQQAPALLPLAGLGDSTAAAAGASAPAVVPPGGVAGTGGGSVGLPAIEVGLGSDGTVQQLHVPNMQLGNQQLQLQLDSHTVDIVALLLQAVRVVVANQLQFLHSTLSQQLQQQQQGDALQSRLCHFGHLTSSLQQQQQQQSLPSAAGTAADAGLQQQQQQQLPDTLELLVGGQPAVTVSFQPWSGRIVLRPGSGYGGDSNMEMGLSLHQHQEAMRSKQDQLYAQLQQQLRGVAGSQATPEQERQQYQQQVVVPCMQDLAAGLLDLCSELLLKQRYSSFVTAARMLSLHHSYHLRCFVSARQQPLLKAPRAAAAAAAAAAAHAGTRGPLLGLHHIYLGMQSVQLPSYLLVLAAGSWCCHSPSAAAADTAAGTELSQLVPAKVASLTPVLCMSFPRRSAGANRDGLLLQLCDAQGLPGPLVKQLRLPAHCGMRGAAAAGAGAGTGTAAANGPAAGTTAASSDECMPRKRSRSSFEAEAQQQQEQQQQQQEQQQQQQQQIDEDPLRQLSDAVEYSRGVLTYERLLLELSALQVSFEEQLLPPAAASSHHLNGLQSLPVSQPPQQRVGSASTRHCIRLLSVPGVQLFQQLQRPSGCSPAAVGLQRVWIECGSSSSPGQWSLRLSGRLYSSSGQEQQQGRQQQDGPQQGPKLQQNHTAAAAAAEGAGSTSCLWCWRYNFGAGDDVRTALLQLQQVLRMQQFLNRLEFLARGQQQLQVADSSVLAVGAPGLTARSRAAAEADGQQDAHARPSKKARHGSNSSSQQIDETHAANGPKCSLPVNGMLQPAGRHNSSNHAQQQQQQSNGLHAPAAPACNGNTVDGSSRRGGGNAAAGDCGLLWHWPGTGLVRLAAYSPSEAVLECGRPLIGPSGTAAAAAAATQPASSAPAAGDAAAGVAVTPQAGDGQQQQAAAGSGRVRFHVCWQPLVGFGQKSQGPWAVQPFVGLMEGSSGSNSGSSSALWPSSSSSTTTWVDVHADERRQQQQQAAVGAPGSSSNSRPKVLTAEQVLAVGCCVSCSAHNAPEPLLAELADMADLGCADVFLDAVAVVGWPLSQLQPLLGPGSPAQLTALLAATTAPQDSSSSGSSSSSSSSSIGGALRGSWRPSVVSSTPAGEWWQLRVTVAAELTPAAGAGSAAAGGAGTAATSSIPPLRHQLLLDLCLVTGGCVKVTVRQLPAPAAAAAQHDTLAGAAAAAGAAEYATAITEAALLSLHQLRPRVPCIITYGTSTWQRRSVPRNTTATQRSAAAAAASGLTGADPLSGFWVPVQSLHTALSHVVQAWVPRVAEAAATAAKAARQAAAQGAASGPQLGAAQPQQQQQPKAEEQPGQQQQQPGSNNGPQLLSQQQQAVLQQQAAAAVQAQQQRVMAGQTNGAAVQGTAAAQAAQGMPAALPPTSGGYVQAGGVAMGVSVAVQQVPQQQQQSMLQGQTYGQVWQPLGGSQQQQHM